MDEPQRQARDLEVILYSKKMGVLLSAADPCVNKV